MTIVIIMCWLTALLVPVWMIVASKLSDRGKGEWKKRRGSNCHCRRGDDGAFHGSGLNSGI